MSIATAETNVVRSRYGDVEPRVAALLTAVREACVFRPGESWDRGNERKVEEFVAWLRDAFPGRVYEVERAAGSLASPASAAPCVLVERQRLSDFAIRTTRWNYVFHVPGDSEDRVVLVAHYDTWRGAGADDNTTGEEILKQYLVADLRAETRPALTRSYFLAGSEECGLIGMTSQVLLALGLIAANLAVASGNWLYALVALGLCPLASYRFGVSGSREYVRTLPETELSRIRAAVSVDSVGEGRLYIPRSTLGADFVRAIIPFGDYDSLNDLLEEGAHLNGIKYNSHLAGGTTDHVSFLEVNNGFRHLLAEAIARAWASLRGRTHNPLPRVPAAALVAMAPGKASPLVWGGKIHTRNDLPDRVFAQPLREALLVTDYLLYRLDGGARPREPRTLGDYHFAQLFRSLEGQHYLALKDAIEPNRRNLNGVYRASLTLEGRRAQVVAHEIVGWGVEVRLSDQAAAVAAERGERWRRVPVDELEVSGQELGLRFARRSGHHLLERSWQRAIAAAESLMGRHSFLTFFGLAWLVSHTVGRGLELAVQRFTNFGVWFFEHGWLTIPVLLASQTGVTLYLMMKRIPTWIDNAYRHDSRADNLSSLRRVAPGPVA